MRLYVLQTAIYQEGGIVYAPFPAYLIQTDDGHNVLVDTGVSEAQIVQNISAQGEYHVVRQENEKLPDQLAAMGLEPADIDTVICTHFDEDHCGNNDLFEGAQFIVQQSHDEVARSGREPRFETCRATWDVPGLNYQRVNGDVELLPGIRLIVTDAHVTGHQSVLVQLPNTGAVLLAIDAIRNGDMLKPGIDPRRLSMFDMNLDGVPDAVEKLRGVIEREHVQLTIFGHDWQRWQALRKAPAFYD